MNSKTGIDDQERMRQAGKILWVEIKDTLAREIGAGVFPLGTRLPVESELAARFGVNRHTVRQALAALREKGSISIEPGRGTFVCAPKLSYPITRRTRFSENLAQVTGNTRGTLVRSREMAASEKMAADLGIPAGAPLLAFDNLRFIEDEPISLTTHHFLLPRFAGLEKLFAESGSVTRALARLGVPDYVRRLTRVHARSASPEEARLLRGLAGTPVLVVESINTEPGGTAIEYGVSRSIGERIELIIDPNSL